MQLKKIFTIYLPESRIQKLIFTFFVHQRIDFQIFFERPKELYIAHLFFFRKNITSYGAIAHFLGKKYLPFFNSYRDFKRWFFTFSYFKDLFFDSQEVLKITRCRCFVTNFKNNMCSCIKVNLKCTNYCECNEALCENQDYKALLSKTLAVIFL